MANSLSINAPSYAPRTVAPRIMISHERDPTDPGIITKPKAKVDEKQAVKELDDLVEKSTNCLIKVSSVFPFDLFPDHITVDVNQVNVVIREFFWAERRHSIHIKDVLDVFIDTSIFFSSIKIIDRGYADNGIEVKYLKTGEAKKLRKIIQGLIIAHRQQLDLSKIDSKDLGDKIEQLGKVKDYE